MSISNSSTVAIQIVSGSNNVEFTAPNTFKLTLSGSGFKSGDDEVCLKSMVTYYSWANISSEKGNNK